MATAEVLAQLPVAPQDWQASLKALSVRLRPGASRVPTDTPDDHLISHHMPQAIGALFASAQQEVLITNA